VSEPKSHRHRFVVETADEALRLDQLLAARVAGLSRRQARVLLDLGGVFVDRARVKMAGRKLRAGQVVEAHVGGALERATKDVGQAARARDEAALPRYRVLHEDRWLVVVDKPSGLLTAPTPESDRNNLAGLLARRPRAGAKRLHVVHRLDRETSGVLVFAKGDEANRRLSEMFREHDLTREYVAVVLGRFPGDETTCEEPVGGRSARTHFTVVERLGDAATVVRARLETGRTHQIRLHARALGCPVAGDRRHGRRAADEPPRLALHAERLAFRHPFTGDALDFRVPLPDDLASWLATRKGV